MFMEAFPLRSLFCAKGRKDTQTLGEESSTPGMVGSRETEQVQDIWYQDCQSIIPGKNRREGTVNTEVFNVPRDSLGL